MLINVYLPTYSLKNNKRLWIEISNFLIIRKLFNTDILFYIYVYFDGNVDLETSLYAKKQIEIYTAHVLYVSC